MGEQSLYERLGGVFAMAAVVDHFSDAIVTNPVVGQALGNAGPGNGALSDRPIAGSEIHADPVGLQRRGRTVRLCRHQARFDPCRPGRGSPRAPHRAREFDEVAAELGRSSTTFRCPQQEKAEVLAAFAAHKGEVTEGFLAGAGAHI